MWGEEVEFACDPSHSVQEKGELVVAAVLAAAWAKIRPSWVFEEDATAFLAIILLV